MQIFARSGSLAALSSAQTFSPRPLSPLHLAPSARSRALAEVLPPAPAVPLPPPRCRGAAQRSEGNAPGGCGPTPAEPRRSPRAGGRLARAGRFARISPRAKRFRGRVRLRSRLCLSTQPRTGTREGTREPFSSTVEVLPPLLPCPCGEAARPSLRCSPRGPTGPSRPPWPRAARWASPEPPPRRTCPAGNASGESRMVSGSAPSPQSRRPAACPGTVLRKGNAPSEMLGSFLRGRNGGV